MGSETGTENKTSDVRSSSVGKLHRIGFFVAAVSVCCAALARDKTDVITLDNGDRVTGEIKTLEHGKLRISTDSFGTVYAEWGDVVNLTSRYEFEIELTDGRRYFGSIGENPNGKQLLVSGQAQSTLLEMGRVIRMTPIENSFLERIEGSLSFGYDVTKSSDVSQFNFNANATHRTRIRAISMKASTVVTRTDEETTERAELALSLKRFRANRWFNAFLGGLESNDQLGLELRTSIGAAVGRYIVQTNSSELQLLSGLLVTQERLHGNEDTLESSEAILGIGYSRFLYDHPNVDIDLQLKIFPSLTESGRVRGQFDARVRREIVEDLYLDLVLYGSYDSDPPSGTDTKTDHGIITSLGWSF